MTDKKFYVYVYVDPVTDTPFYIGKGTKNRAWDHLRDSRYPYMNDPKHCKIRSMYESGVVPKVIIAYKNLTEEEAFQKESSLISHYGRRDHGGVLLNMTDGGEGNTGLRYCSDTTVYTFFHKDGSEKRMTRLEFREKICKGNHQTCAPFFSGKNKFCHNFTLNKENIDSELFCEDTEHSFYKSPDVSTVYKISLKSCADHGIPKRDFKKLVKGSIPSFKGWYLESNKKNIFDPENRHTLVNIDTGEIIFVNKREFRKYAGVQATRFDSLVAGDIHHIKRWFRGAEVGEEFLIRYDLTRKYKVENTKTGEVRFLTIPELKSILPHKKTECFDIARGKVKHYGWRLYGSSL